MPFGPALAAGAVIAAFWGPQIADWYQRTILHT
jgi:prepilin signal peptidase PulO-like enzyme (type II secretory pathway)